MLATPWLNGGTLHLVRNVAKLPDSTLRILGDVGEVGVPVSVSSENSPESITCHLLLPLQLFVCLLITRVPSVILSMCCVSPASSLESVSSGLLLFPDLSCAAYTFSDDTDCQPCFTFAPSRVAPATLGLAIFFCIALPVVTAGVFMKHGYPTLRGVARFCGYLDLVALPLDISASSLLNFSMHHKCSSSTSVRQSSCCDGGRRCYPLMPCKLYKAYCAHRFAVLKVTSTLYMAALYSMSLKLNMLPTSFAMNQLHP